MRPWCLITSEGAVYTETDLFEKNPVYMEMPEMTGNNAVPMPGLCGIASLLPEGKGRRMQEGWRGVVPVKVSVKPFFIQVSSLSIDLKIINNQLFEPTDQLGCCCCVIVAVSGRLNLE